MPLTPFQTSTPDHFITDMVASFAFSGATLATSAWTFGDVNVIGLAASLLVFLANFGLAVYRHFDAKKERAFADKQARAEVERRIKAVEEAAYMRGKLDGQTGTISGKFHSQLTQPLTPDMGDQ